MKPGKVLISGRPIGQALHPPPLRIGCAMQRGNNNAFVRRESVSSSYRRSQRAQDARIRSGRRGRGDIRPPIDTLGYGRIMEANQDNHEHI
jgi:hypothetical protein